MPKYRADFIDAAIGVNTTIGSHGASSATQARRHKLLELFVGIEDPADQVARLVAQRYTVDGTGTAVVPTPLDPADAAMLGEAAEAHTVEPTYTGVLYVAAFDIHMRNPLLYYAPPGGEIVVPATDDSGIGYWWADISSGTPSAMATVLLEE